MFVGHFEGDCSRDEYNFILRGFLVYALKMSSDKSPSTSFISEKAINRKHLFN